METLFGHLFSSSIGTLQLVASPDGLVYLGFSSKGQAALTAWQRRHAPKAHLTMERHEWVMRARQEVLEFLRGERRNFECSLDLRCTEFARKAYAALQRIPYGATASYGEIAHALGQPLAARAVGHACATNPLPLFIPCHRVIASGGGLGGFGGGLDLKRALLAIESRTAIHQIEEAKPLRGGRRGDVNCGARSRRRSATFRPCPRPVPRPR